MGARRMPRAGGARVRTDWDLVYRHERMRRRHAPLDFRRWKRASQVALRERFAGKSVRVLDATCGLGDHTINLAELGFLTEACDASAEACEATREAVVAAGLDVAVFAARWEELGARKPERYDLVFHDALHWIEGDDAMHRSLLGLRGALRAGGALAFFFADPERPEPGAGLEYLAWDREHLEAHTLQWDQPTERGRVSHVRVAIATEAAIDEHHVYVVHEGDGARIESTVLRRIYRWDWHAMSAACARAGFTALDALHFTSDKGHRTPICLATR